LVRENDGLKEENYEKTERIEFLMKQIHELEKLHGAVERISQLE